MRWTLLAALVTTLSACATFNAETAPDAVLTNPSDETRAELTGAISGMLGDRKVMLAQDVLTVKSSVTIEQKEMMGPDGNPIMGRRFDTPDHFFLKQSGSRCVLWHQQSGEHVVLNSVDCKPL